jgi:excisionase family DNA binding protein
MTRDHRAPGRCCLRESTGSDASRTCGELLTVPEVMTHLRLGRTTIYDLIRTGRLASVRIGQARRIPTHAVHDLIRRETEPLQEPR